MAEKGEVVGAYLLSDANQQRTRAACGVADHVAGGCVQQFRQEHGDLAGCVELSALLAGIRGEAADQVFVGVADDVLIPDATRTEVELRLGEILQEVVEASVPVPGLTKIRFGVKVDVSEDVFQFGLVGVLDRFQGDVDQLTDVGPSAPLIEAVEAGREGLLEITLLVPQPNHRHDEALPAQGSLDAPLVSLVAMTVVLLLVLPEVGQVFDEQHHQDVVLVLGGVQSPPEGIARLPEYVVDLFLGDDLGHESCFL